MNEELMGQIFEMISASGSARTKYIEAVAAAKKGDFEAADKMIQEGSACFHGAHEAHARMLQTEAAGIEASGNSSNVSLILVHAEDQLMAAESFRIIAEEFIDVYKRLGGGDS